VAARLAAIDSQNCIHNIACSCGAASLGLPSPRLKHSSLQTSGIRRAFPWLYVVIWENTGKKILAVSDVEEMRNISALAYSATCIQLSTTHRPDTL